MEIIKFNDEEFITFLNDAKKEGYAGGDKQKIRKDDYSRHYYYERSLFRYHDTYYGNLADCGREVVYFKGRPIWGMNYHGGVFEDYDECAKDIFDFLREALSLPPREFPVRGPKVYLNPKFTYLNRYYGDILNFFGEETIVSNEYAEQVYLKHYLGGLIRDREYKVIIHIKPKKVD